MDNNIITIKLKGELADENVEYLKNEYLKYLETGKKHFVLDFENVNYVSSMGIAAILYLHKKLDAVDGSVELINLDSKLKKFFSILGLPKGFILK